MGSRVKSASERQFQEDVTRRLLRYRWTAPEELDGNHHHVTVETLVANWRRELNRLNADVLENIPLTDGEFRQVMSRVKAIENSYEAAKLLAMENGTGKIDGIQRDPNPKVTKRSITLTIFRKADVGGGESTYQIAREVWGEKGNRFDLILLINGLPLINIEQKRADVPLDEAFHQFRRYYEAGEFVHGFLAFSQMMVCMSPVETRYFATPKALSWFNPSFVFHWADDANAPINDWESIVDHFLYVPMAHQMVGDYLVIYEAANPEDACHMLLRPYQVYALRAVEMAALGFDVKTGGIRHGGYVWHTTGAGKTITSFKTALFLSTRAGFDKILFLVDRRELDTSTSRRFKEYAIYEPVPVDDTKSTAGLKKSLKEPGIVVTTTFKLHNLVKELLAAGDMRLAEKRFVFIIDEAHRTTMGQMLGTIKQYFRRNGLFYGFTGTPLFDENHVAGVINEASEAIRTTEALFGPLLHKYTIDEAIADKNVLGFHIKYLNTGEFTGYDDLRDRLTEKLAADPSTSEEQAEETVAGWDDLRVETEAEKAGLFRYQDETHIPRVVERILAGWEAQSQGRTFNAILTVAYKKRVLAYYQEFKRQLAGTSDPIHIAMTVSFGNPNDPDRLPVEFVQEMFQDYEAYTGVSFTAGDKKNGEDAYYRDLVTRGTRGGSGRNGRNIDLIIVADQMLTGWDDKYLNTLYCDRMLELQGLIQAYSRTNRVLGPSKEFGTIVNFLRPRQTEAAVNEALRLYGSGGKTSRAIVDTYAVAVEKLQQKVEAMRAALPNPTDWQLLEQDEKGKEAFLKAFREASGQLARVEQYYEFDWDAERFAITEEEWLYYVGAYKNLLPKDEDEGEETIIPLPGTIRTVTITKVTASYIIQLIGEKAKAVHGVSTLDPESKRILLEKIKDLENHGETAQAQMLYGFVEDIEAGKIPAEGNADEAFTRWKGEQLSLHIHDFAKRWGAKESLLREALGAYDRTQRDKVPRLQELRDSLDYGQAEEKVEGDFFDFCSAFDEAMPLWLRETAAIYR